MRKVRPDGDLAGIASLVDAEDAALRVAAITAAGLWHVDSLEAKLQELSAARETSDAVRRAALRTPRGTSFRAGGPGRTSCRRCA
jgi:hypothetical protein